jgi:hypothetical protein
MLEDHVLPDGPTARGAATSWRVYLVVAGASCAALAMPGSYLRADQREDRERWSLQEGYTRQEVAALRAGGLSGRTRVFAGIESLAEAGGRYAMYTSGSDP